MLAQNVSIVDQVELIQTIKELIEEIKSLRAELEILNNKRNSL